jgi:2,4-dienoyl-CoA reductase-like NADH-dependent reductase (Old Yellow Enzyme family)
MKIYEHLFSPFAIGDVQLKNRIVMLPMTTGFCEPDGSVGGRLTQFFAARAAGGAGLIIAPFAPLPTGSVVDAGLFADHFVEPARRLTEAVHRFGARISAQLIVTYGLVLDEASGQSVPEVVGPSPVKNSLLRVVSRELTSDEVRHVVDEFAAAAGRAQAAGFDMVEVMAGGGYLLNRFLSPLTNLRTDAYGGSFENRLRILLEIVRGIRERTGAGFPVMVRLNLDEQMEGGYSTTDALEMARRLESAGVAGFTSYTGWHESPVPTVLASVPKAGFAHLAERLKTAVSVPVVAANRINDPSTAEQVMAAGKADLVGMGRALLADPDLPNKAQQGRGDEIVPCIACSHCLTAMLVTYRRPKEPATTVCAVNPSLAAAASPKATAGPASSADEELAGPATPKRVMVIGGGPAGLEAARAAAARGHHVTLYEKAGRPGGRLLVAAVPPFKHELEDLVRALTVRAERAGVELRFGQAVDRETIEGERPDVLIVAVGAIASVLPVLGATGENVAFAEQVLAGDRSVGGEVLVIGGGLVGCETAEYMVERGRGSEGAQGSGDVTGVRVVEMLDRMAANVSATSRPFLLARLRAKGVRLSTGLRVIEIEPFRVKVEAADGFGFIQADSIVLATGYETDAGAISALLGIVSQTHLIGDCAGGRTIKEALEQGFAVGTSV